MSAVQVSEEEFEKAGGDPLKIPRIAEALGKIPEIVEEEERQKAESQHTGDAQEMLCDGEVLYPIVAGVQVIRDITAGVFNLLNKMKSPIVTGVEIEDDNEWLEHISFVLFLMSYPDERQLVRWFAKGAEYLWEEFMVWSFNNVDLAELMKDQDCLNEMISSVAEASADEEGDGYERDHASPKVVG